MAKQVNYPATEPQINAVFAVGRQQGYTDAHLEAQCAEFYGHPVDELTRREAAEFIDWLKSTPRHVNERAALLALLRQAEEALTAVSEDGGFSDYGTPEWVIGPEQMDAVRAALAAIRAALPES
jgi:hypothetical protein